MHNYNRQFLQFQVFVAFCVLCFIKVKLSIKVKLFVFFYYVYVQFCLQRLSLK